MKSDMDNREWLDDYPSLKQVNINTPFTVPDNYFDDLHQTTMLRAIIDGINANTETDFTVPENYFNDLADNLQSRIAIEAALEHNNTGFTVPDKYFEDMQGNLQSRIAIEAAMDDTRGFTVPANYFEEMQASLQSQINIEEALQHTTGNFTTPAGYFEDQHQQINSRIVVEEVLNSQTEGFTVPANYFDGLQNAILSKTTGQAAVGVKRNAIIRKMFATSTYKYATAACFVAAIGGALFLNHFESPEAKHERSYIHKALSVIPDKDLIKYLQMNIDQGGIPAATEATNQIDDKDAQALKEYLDIHQ